MGGDSRAYLLARAIQFFLPGVPQVYYVGLLAGRNDMDLLARTGVGRDINRHHYTRAEVNAALDQNIVADLIAMIRLRNKHPAFGGEFHLLPTGDEALAMRWQKGDDWAELKLTLSSRDYQLRFSAEEGESEIIFESDSVTMN
jgi:sucrose phosphorylase